MSEFWALMEEYKEAFGEQFPLMHVYGMEESEIMSIVRNCINSMEKYKPKEVDGEI